METRLAEPAPQESALAQSGSNVLRRHINENPRKAVLARHRLWLDSIPHEYPMPYAACIYAGTNASVYIKDNEVTVEDATGQNICRQGKRIRGVVGDFGQGVGNGYYVEKSMTELRNLTRQEWQTRLAGQMVSTGTELQVTSYDELRNFIQDELGELFEEDIQK